MGKNSNSVRSCPANGLQLTPRSAAIQLITYHKVLIWAALKRRLRLRAIAIALIRIPDCTIIIIISLLESFDQKKKLEHEVENEFIFCKKRPIKVARNTTLLPKLRHPMYDSRCGKWWWLKKGAKEGKAGEEGKVCSISVQGHLPCADHLLCNRAAWVLALRRTVHTASRSLSLPLALV